MGCGASRPPARDGLRRLAPAAALPTVRVSERESASGSFRSSAWALSPTLQRLLEEEGILEEGWDDEVAQTRISQIQRDIDAIKEEAQQRVQRKKAVTLH